MSQELFTYVTGLAAETSVNLAAHELFLNASGTAKKVVPWRLSQVKAADIASAATLNLDASTGDLVDVTGTTTVTAITLAEGRKMTIRFTGILTLTHGASLVLPTGANISTVAGDFAVFRGYAAGVVRCTSYTRASGAALAGAGLGGSTGATDNAIIRADGTGGATVQSSGATISDAGLVTAAGFVGNATALNTFEVYPGYYMGITDNLYFRSGTGYKFSESGGSVFVEMNTNEVTVPALQMAERTAPAAPAANNGVMYLEDNGSGKTRLMILFSSGASQQLAIQP